MTRTPLDEAHAAMEAEGTDAARLRFYGALAEAELFLLLAREADGDRAEPAIYPLEEGPVALAFDREARLAGFAGGDAPAPFAAMSGRALAGMLAGQGIGLGLNLGAPSEILLPAAAVDWLAAVAARPAEAEGIPREVRAPGGLPEALLHALGAKLALAAGLAPLAWLAGVTYEGGRRSHLLAFVGARPGAEGALAQAAGEALVFSGLEAGEMDVAFLAPDAPLAARLARVALRIDLPQPVPAPRPAPPGSDPDSPPRLR